MDIRTGRTYATREDALAAGVPESDIAEVIAQPSGPPVPRFGPVIAGTGMFKGRFYRRDLATGNLISVKKLRPMSKAEIAEARAGETKR